MNNSTDSVVARWERLGRAGITVSVCYGQNGNRGPMYSVDAYGPNGQSFQRPFACETLEQSISIAETESVDRGWLSPD